MPPVQPVAVVGRPAGGELLRGPLDAAAENGCRTERRGWRLRVVRRVQIVERLGCILCAAAGRGVEFVVLVVTEADAPDLLTIKHFSNACRHRVSNGDTALNVNVLRGYGIF